MSEELGTFQIIDRLRNLDMGPVFPSRILTNDLLFDIILDSASPATMLRLAKTCRQAYNAVTSYIPRAFDINKQLSRFFSDPLGFRSLQARTSTHSRHAARTRVLDSK